MNLVSLRKFHSLGIKEEFSFNILERMAFTVNSVESDVDHFRPQKSLVFAYSPEKG